MREQTTGAVVSWLKELPGKVADEIVVPLLAVAVLAVIALAAGLLVSTRVQLWVVVLALAVGLVAGALIVHLAGADNKSTEADLENLRRSAEELRPTTPMWNTFATPWRT